MTLRAILLPAAIFQSVIVGGAYGTGREVVEFISVYGALGGFLTIAVIALAFTVVLAASFEFARCFSAWDYRHFLRALLGRGWVAYELMFVVLLLIVLAVTAAAAGQILGDAVGVPRSVGAGVLFACVVVLNFWGRDAVQRTLGAGAIVLCSAIVASTIAVCVRDHRLIAQAMLGPSVYPGWWLSGIKFAVYNSALIPVIIYCARSLPDRSTALWAGLLAGLLGVIPALCFHLSFLSALPEVLDQALPTYSVIARFNWTAAVPLYVFILFATIVQTAVGVLHGVNERLDAWSQETRGRGLSHIAQAAIAGAMVVASLLLSKLGLISLIANGYGTLAWGFFLVFTAPLLSAGVIKIVRADRQVNPRR